MTAADKAVSPSRPDKIPVVLVPRFEARNPHIVDGRVNFLKFYGDDGQGGDLLDARLWVLQY